DLLTSREAPCASRAAPRAGDVPVAARDRRQLDRRRPPGAAHPRAQDLDRRLHQMPVAAPMLIVESLLDRPGIVAVSEPNGDRVLLTEIAEVEVALEQDVGGAHVLTLERPPRLLAQPGQHGLELVARHITHEPQL